MFTQQQIEAIHAKVKTGADFPRLIQDFKKAGIISYEHMVGDGSNRYYGANDFSVIINRSQSAIFVADNSSSEKLRHAIAIHQQGKTDYPTFCLQAGEAGVEKWVSDLEKMVVIYIDKQGRELVAEPIPAGDY